MLPKFDIHESDGRFSVETDWSVDAPDLGPNARRGLMIGSANGTLSTSGQTWGSRKLAEKAIEKCKARFR